MSIYFIRQGDNGPIKIGTAINPQYRIRELQSGNHEPLRLLAAIPGGRAEASALHHRFAELSINRTDWFRAETGLLAFVDGLAYASPQEPAPPPVADQTLFGLSRDQVFAVVGAVEYRSLTDRAIEFVEETTGRAWLELEARDYRTKLPLTTLQRRSASNLLCALEQVFEFMTSPREHPVWDGARFIGTAKQIGELRESIQSIVDGDRLPNAEEAVPLSPIDVETGPRKSNPGDLH